MTAAEVSLDCTGTATVAVLRHRDGRIEHLHFDGAAELPSGVYQADDGQLLSGRAALDASMHDSSRYVPMPLNLLTTTPAPDDAGRPAAIVAAVLGRVREQAAEAAGAQVNRAVVVVPPSWGPQRRTRLRDAAHRAGLTDIDIVDAATALAHHHAAPRSPGRCTLVIRLAGPDAEATIVNPGDDGFDIVAAISDSDVGALDSGAMTEHTAALVTRALASAELASTAISTAVILAPAAQLPAFAAGLRQAGITATTRTASQADTTLGALAVITGQTPATPRRLGQARHAIAAAVPLAGAAALLWLLLHTAIYPLSPLAEQISPTPIAGIVTLWPAWGMLGILVYLGAAAIVLRSADHRLCQSNEDTEAERRLILARGLRITAGVAATAALVSAMLGAFTYPTMSVVQLLMWTIGPAVLLAVVAVVIAGLIRDGHTSALRWQIWLRLPNSSVVLATVGLLLIHADLYAREYWPTALADLLTTASQQDPTGLDRLGAIAIALAVLPLLLRHLRQQILVSPLVILLILLTHSYTNTGFVVGAFLLALSLWWITRIRPAGAFGDPHHPASVLAAELEPAAPASV